MAKMVMQRSLDTTSEIQFAAGSDKKKQTAPQVVLSTLGKFHTFDLARQLDRFGALRAIFTGYPRFKLRDEQLPRNKVRTFPYLHAPYMRLGSASGLARKLWERQDRFWLDQYTRASLPDCDVFCGLSGSGLRTGQLARKRGAKYVCDRGSSHIRFQDDVLRREYDAQSIAYSGIDPWIVEREETEYAEADIITVPSQFAYDSFQQYGVPAAKLRRVPYGVDLSRFHPVSRPSADEFRVLFVGAISVRKGTAYLLKAFDRIRHPRKHLTLIGTVAEELLEQISKLRGRPDISVLGAVPQHQLKVYMSESHAMVLPSVEEGLALVQAQAMACRCPLISSSSTGASDLFSDGTEGFIVRPQDADVLAARLQTLADDSDLREHMAEAALRRVRSMGGWDEYGVRMYTLFSAIRN
jgi:alpha-maltose-1-phosphate synthase